ERGRRDLRRRPLPRRRGTRRRHTRRRFQLRLQPLLRLQRAVELPHPAPRKPAPRAHPGRRKELHGGVREKGEGRREKGGGRREKWGSQNGAAAPGRTGDTSTRAKPPNSSSRGTRARERLHDG